MTIKVKRLKPHTHEGSGRVRRFSVPDTEIQIVQISTFCPDIIGPGPVHIYLIDNGDAQVKVLRHAGRWCGITYPGDRARMRAFIASIIEAGEYPRRLW